MRKTEPKVGTIYLAGGCFWGVQEFFSRLPGVLETEVGYINGNQENTSYEQLKQTEHAEVVKVSYDAHLIHPAELIYQFFRIIEPTSLDRQGNDIGRQYRTGIYAEEDSLLDLARAIIDRQQLRFQEPIAVEVEEVINYQRAENYHQDYLEKNPGGYCHINPAIAETPLLESSEGPRYPLRDIQAEEKRLADEDQEAYHIMRESGTEAPFTSALNEELGLGIYVDKLSGEPLFSSKDKFDAGCGWPSFSRPLIVSQIKYLQDTSHGMQRVETRAETSDAHLGHVFEDGPTDLGGLRYCINGAALEFIPIEEMEDRGYGDFIPFLEY